VRPAEAPLLCQVEAAPARYARHRVGQEVLEGPAAEVFFGRFPEDPAAGGRVCNQKFDLGSLEKLWEGSTP
jgi:hypothetical protein